MQLNSISPNAVVGFKAISDKGLENIQKDQFKNVTEYDTVEFSKTSSELSTADKQKLIQQARTTAAGWSAFGGVISTLCYGLRSDKKVAEKFNLDVEKDASLIRKIKQDQMLATLPAALGTLLFGFGTLITGGITWLYNKNADPAKIDVNKTI